MFCLWFFLSIWANSVTLTSSPNFLKSFLVPQVTIEYYEALRLNFVILFSKKELPPLRNSGLNLALSKWTNYLGMRCNITGIQGGNWPRHARVIVENLAEGLDRLSAQLDVGAVARDLWSPPIHGSLHILVDPVTRGCGGKSTNMVKNPREGWANIMEGRDGELLKGMK